MATAKRRARKGKGSLIPPTGRVRTWAAKWAENGVRKYRGGFATKAEAEAVLADITAEVRAGRAGIPSLPIGPKTSPTVDSLSAAFLDQRGANVTDDRNRWTRDVVPSLGDRRVDAVDTSTVSALVSALRDRGLDGASVERALYLASAFYRWAKREKHASVNPVADYLSSLLPRERKRLKSTHDPKDTPFVESKAAITRLYKALPSPVNLVYALSALAGLRPGEAVGLEWADVDLKAGAINVRQQVRHGKVGQTKSGKPRVVPIVPGLLAVLKAAKAESKSTLVAPGRSGAHLGPKTIAAAMKVACKAAKVTSLTLYEAGRHTFASQWVLAGQDIYRLSEIMGHASIVTTQRYAHLTKATPASVLAAVNVDLG